MIDKEIVEEIKEFIELKKKEYSIDTLYPNVILKSDVFQILAQCSCTIIYYPLPENEGNNGFHIGDIPGKDGEKYHFVFINTSQTMDKQVFTAAHELGHEWKVDDYICERHNAYNSESSREEIVSRFAAELLMPENEFSKQYAEEIKKYDIKEKQISFNDFLKLVSRLMFVFLSPMKAVMRRMAELGMISSDTIDSLISEKEEKPSLEALTKKTMERIIREEGYAEQFKPTGKKYIDGLEIMLEAAEDNHLVSAEKIKNMRELFDIPSEAREKAYDYETDYIRLESEAGK